MVSLLKWRVRSICTKPKMRISRNWMRSRWQQERSLLTKKWRFIGEIFLPDLMYWKQRWKIHKARKWQLMRIRFFSLRRISVRRLKRLCGSMRQIRNLMLSIRQCSASGLRRKRLMWWWMYFPEMNCWKVKSWTCPIRLYTLNIRIRKVMEKVSLSTSAW